MKKYSEAFVGLDTAKKKHALAVAGGGRNGEVRYVGELDSSPATVEKAISMRIVTGSCTSATKPVRPDTDCIAR